MARVGGKEGQGGRDWVLLGLVGAAALLRLWRVGQQIVVDDETFTVRGAAEHDFTWLATHLDLGEGMLSFAPALGLYVRSVALSVGVGEWTLRLPFLAAGVALPVLLARWLRPHVDRTTLLFSVAFVSFSPILIHYSRIARPYGLIVLLEVAAAAALWRFLSTPSVRPIVVHAISSALALWLNRSAGVCLASLWLAAGFWIVLAHRDRIRFLGARLACAVIASLLLATVLYVPALLESGGSLLGRPGAEAVGFGSLRGAFVLLVGSWRWPVLVAVLAFIAMGFVRLARESCAVAVAAALLLFTPTLGLLVLHPAWLHEPPILLRYQIGIVPLALVLVAFGVSGLLEATRGVLRLHGNRAHALAFCVGGGLIATLAATGPLPETHLRRNDFGAIYVNARWWRRSAPSVPVPAFYRQIAQDERRGAVAEAPWNSRFAQQLDLLQQVHGRSVIVVSDTSITRTPGFHLRRMLPPEFDRIEASDALWLVVHLDAVREDRFFAGWLGVLPNVQRSRSLGVKELLEQAEQRYGAPVYRDRWIAAFRLHQS